MTLPLNVVRRERMAAAATTSSWAAAGAQPYPMFWAQPADGAIALGPNNTGKVLVAGGEDGRRNPLSAAMLFDPAANTWSATGALVIGRRLHSATRLSDGRVLVAGGVPGPVAVPARGTAAAEIYDPSTGVWTQVAPMTEPRYSHSATLLPDGTVLVAGGCSGRSPDSNRALRTAEIFNPATGQWVPAAPMTDIRFGHTAILLQNKKVLVAGGLITVGRGQYTALAYCELYDTTTTPGSWTPTGSLGSPRKGHQATLLGDGTVLASGGDLLNITATFSISPYSLSSCERYNPATGTWAADAALPWGLSQHRAVLLPTSGKVLVAGGTDSGTFDIGYSNAMLYDPVAKTWTQTAGMAVGRWAPAITALPGDKALVVGGIVRSGAAAPTPGEDLLTATAEVFTL